MYFSCRSKENEKHVDSSSKAEGQGQEYSVEKILDKRTRNGIVEYFLKWTDYDDSENSWEPEENLHCEELVNDFEEKLKKEKKNTQPVRNRKRTFSKKRCASSDDKMSKKNRNKSVKSNKIQDTINVDCEQNGESEDETNNINENWYQLFPWEGLLKI